MSFIPNCSKQAAKYASLVMYACDMCNVNLHDLKPKFDERIAIDGWNIVGFITGNDLISTYKLRLKITHLKKEDLVCYGYVAQNAAGTYAAVIRGTDDFEEWLDDFDFFKRKPKAPLEGEVESGFYDIFDSLKYTDLSGSTPLRLATGIAGVIGKQPLVLLGHSLGSALICYLSAELYALKIQIPEEEAQITAYMFASPKPGNLDFANYFANNVKNYYVYNFNRDIVPKLPLNDYFSLPEVIMLTEDASLLTISKRPNCNHHIICYIALLDIDEFKRVMALPATTADNHKCASCVCLK